MTHRRWPFVLIALELVACTAADDPADPLAPVSDATRRKAAEAMWADLAAGTPHTFIVALDDVRVQARTIAADGSQAWAAEKQRLLDPVDLAELAVVQDWDELPLMQVEAATVEAATALLDEDTVAAAYEIETYQTSDAESYPLVNQPAAAAAGKTGANTAIAVLDTGTDYTRAAFGACTAPGLPSTTCKVTVARDFAPEDNTRDDNGHGTNVAGIALGAAPDTRILALDVFQGGGASSTDIISAINWAVANKATHKIAALNLSLGGGSSTAPCANDAIGIALGAARTAGIAPVVASGNNGFATALASPACSPAAISVGAVYDANVGGLGYGVCSDPTTAADKITCFSNSASFLTVLAPGALINAAGITMAGTSQAAPHVAGAMAVLRAAYPAETVDQLVARLTTTGKRITDPRNNVTTPRIDVLAAVTQAQADTTPPTGTVKINAGATGTRSATVTLTITGTDPSGVGQMCVSNTSTCTSFEVFASTRTWTLSSGDGTKTVTVFLRDSRGNTTTATTSPRASILLDATAPTGTIKINGGAPTTRVAAVTLTLTGADTSGVTRMCIGEGTTCTSYVAFVATASYTLSATNGTRTLRAWFADPWGNVSAGVPATIVLDTVPPTVGALAATAGPSKVSLTWTAATDATSGLAGYRLVGAAGTTAPAAACTGTVLYAGAGTSFVHAVTARATWTYRLCAIDRAGNVSAGVTRTVRAL